MPENGFWLPARPSSTPIARGAATGRMLSPSAIASSAQSSRSRQTFGRAWRWVRVNTAGRPHASTTRRSMANSALWSGAHSETISSKPVPASRRPMAMPVSSSSCARSVGVGSPLRVLWLRLREVEKPNAPACIASRAISRICAMSPWLAFSSAMARSPMTNTRTAACGSSAQTSMSRGRRSSASRYSPKVSHCQSRPSCITAPGMSSTPSISSISCSRSAGLQGAKPTPQLPITAVVTPCQAEGARWLSHTAWAS